MVGKGGFEPPTSCSRSMRANQTALLPEMPDSPAMRLINRSESEEEREKNLLILKQYQTGPDDERIAGVAHGEKEKIAAPETDCLIQTPVHAAEKGCQREIESVARIRRQFHHAFFFKHDIGAEDIKR